MIVIFNPAAGSRRRSLLDRVLTRLAAVPAAVELRPTARAGDAEEIAASLSPPTDGLVVAAGGDGTLAEVLNGLIRNPARDAFRLGVIPLGTANVLAHEIGLPRRAGPIAETLLSGRILPLHPGRIRHSDGSTRHFLMMAGAGFDAAVVEGVSAAAKRHLGKGAYVAETLRQAASGNFPDLAVEVDGARYAAQSVVVCNGRHYGGPYVLAPEADLSEAAFQVVLLARAGGLSTLGQGIDLMRGRFFRSRGVRILPARRVVLSGPVGQPVQTDGDASGTLPVALETTAFRVSLMVPARP
jgi:diacylglycerol kinase family enzyme